MWSSKKRFDWHWGAEKRLGCCSWKRVVVGCGEFVFRLARSVVHLEAKRTGGNQQSTGSCSGEPVTIAPLFSLSLSLSLSLISLSLYIYRYIYISLLYFSLVLCFTWVCFCWCLCVCCSVAGSVPLLLTLLLMEESVQLRSPLSHLTINLI